MFMSKKPEARLTLADMIMEKITEKQTEIQTQFTDAESRRLNTLSYLTLFFNQLTKDYNIIYIQLFDI